MSSFLCRASAIGMLLCFLAVSQTACGDKARDLFETAQFEEQQFNRQHATQLYLEILEKHPKSPYAKRAQERLEQLEKK